MADIDVSFYPKAPQGNPFLDTAGAAIGVANAAQQNQLLGVQTQQAQQALGMERLGVLRSAIGAIAAKPDANYGDFAGLGALAEQGLIDPGFYQSELAKVPKDAPPDVYRALANQYNAQLATVQERYAMQTGIPLGSAGQPTTYIGPTGAEVTTTMGRFANDVGIGPSNPLTAGQPSQINPLMPVGEAMPAQVQAQSGGPITAPSPQQMKMYESSAQQYQADLQAAANWQQTKQPLEKLIELYPVTQTGVGQELPNTFAKVAQTFGIPWGEDQAKNVTELEKYASQLALSSGLAGNSIEHLLATQTATPGVNTNNAAGQDVAKALLTLARFKQGVVLAAQEAGIAPEKYSEFASKWASTHDLRAFGFDKMTPKAMQALKKELEGDEAAKRKFMSSYRAAQGLGLLD